MSIKDYYTNELNLKFDKKDIKSVQKSLKNIEKMLKNSIIKKIEVELKIGYNENP